MLSDTHWPLEPMLVKSILPWNFKLSASKIVVKAWKSFSEHLVCLGYTVLYKSLAQTNRAPHLPTYACVQVKEILPLNNLTHTTMDADYDGPCAVPQPDSIQESMADPLAVFGFALIATSLLLVAFTKPGQGSRRYGCLRIIPFGIIPVFAKEHHSSQIYLMDHHNG